jgi:hypothetical protein
MHAYRSAVILLLLTFLFVEAEAQGFLRVSGTKIVKGSGEEIILRGIGLGGWLVPEGYMLQTSDFANSPTEIRAKIATLIGDANTDQFFQQYRKNYVNRRDIDRIAQWGFNAIRLPMHYALFTPQNQPGVYLEEGFAIVDSLLSWCEANRLYLILDLHCAPGGQNSGNISDYISGLPSLWESQENQTRTIDLWKKLAARYATKEWIGGYDLLNETNWDLGAANLQLRELSVGMTDAIRQVDRNHMIFIEGNRYATDFNGLAPPWDSNMVYSFHKYGNTNDQGSISGYLNLRSSTKRPLWLGESGENSNQWFADCIALMESNGIGWSWWPHKKIESVAGPLSAVKAPEYDNLLKYWKGQTAQPSVPYAVNALNAQAMNLDIDRCEYHPDVIDALFRQPFTDARVPFAANIIPGIIYAVNYDLGKNYVAYRDLDYQNTSNGSWNSGWQYRNDGVDIEKCSDAITNGYNVGWIGSGEYLVFTVRVLQAGTYAISLRAAGNASGGQVLLRWNNQPFTGFIEIPVTGGWQSWRSLNLGEYQFEAGTHALTLNFYVGGFNINCVQFDKVGTGIGSDGSDPVTYDLEQNCPNPFNPGTVIRYALPAASRVTLTVYDPLGRIVQRLVNEEKGVGNHQATFRGEGLSSGVYFYRLRALPLNGRSGEFVQTRRLMLLK